MDEKEFVIENCKIELCGSEITYRTRWADYPVKGQDGSPIGTIFYYEYVRTDAAARNERPVLFAYNGGPGASCFWLHMGCFGPKRVQTDWLLAPDAKNPGGNLLEINRDCPLNVCDIVLMDPVGTGYGQLFTKETSKDFFNMETDAAVTADFIADWLRVNNRLHSPVYLAGESYGTMRSALVASCLTGGPTLPLQRGRGISPAGIILMGNSLIAQPTSGLFSEKGLPLCVQILPTCAASHWYYQEEKDCMLKDWLDAVDQFIEKDYLQALYLGNRLSLTVRMQLADKLSEFTGLSAQWLLAHQLQFDGDFYRRERLAEQGFVMSGYDARFVRRNSTETDPVADDGALAALTPVFIKGFHDYQEELGIDTEREFIYTDFHLAMDFGFNPRKTPFEHLQAAVSRDKNLCLFFASGVYDFRSEAGQAAYAAAKLIAEEGQIMVKTYPSGHMPYVGEESAALFGQDVRKFIRKGESE